MICSKVMAGFLLGTVGGAALAAAVLGGGCAAHADDGGAVVQVPCNVRGAATDTGDTPIYAKYAAPGRSAADLVISTRLVALATSGHQAGSYTVEMSTPGPTYYSDGAVLLDCGMIIKASDPLPSKSVALAVR